MTFKKWLEEYQYTNSRTISSRVSNFNRLQKSFRNNDWLNDIVDFQNVFDYLDDVTNKKYWVHFREIEIKGDKKSGLATLKHSAKLYSEYLEFETFSYQYPYIAAADKYKIVRTIKRHKKNTKIKNIKRNKRHKKIINIKRNKRKSLNSTKKSFVKTLQHNIYLDLKKQVPGYKWGTEVINTGRVFKDRIDILGTPKNTNDPIVIIELDAHRADQVAKKFVSRTALYKDEKIIYIAVCYSGTKHMSISECNKYFTFCDEIYSLLVDKDFYGIML